jgi:2-dehydro-3-deoxygalactonokinase
MTLGTPPVPTSIVGDWGTSHLRLFLCAGDAVIDRRRGPGLASIAATRQPFEQAFRETAGNWLSDHPCLGATLCGMVGANVGWTEVPYVECPVDPGRLAAAQVRLTAAGIRVAIVPGLACINHLSVPDVMRGEETQIVGALALDPKLALGRRIICLPGTHSKWALLNDGMIERFTTGLTGELFGALRQHSILLHGAATDGCDTDAFDAGVTRSIEAGAAQLPFLLFETRSRQLRGGMTASAAHDFLSGLLIGAEIVSAGASVCSDAPTSDSVVFVGEADIVDRYARAFAAIGRNATTIDGEAAALAGLNTIQRMTTCS